jgi:hypothetical protein
VTIINNWLLCRFDTVKTNKYAKEIGIKTQSISLICCICIYFCMICFSQISQFYAEICTKIFRFTAERILCCSDFHESQHFFLETMFVRYLEGVVTQQKLLHIITFVVTQQPFAGTQKKFVDTQQLFAHLDVCCYTMNMLIHHAVIPIFLHFTNFML